MDPGAPSLVGGAGKLERHVPAYVAHSNMFFVLGIGYALFSQIHRFKFHN